MRSIRHGMDYIVLISTMQTMERRKLNKFTFPVLILAHTGWNVTSSIFKVEKYEGLM